MSDLRSSLAAGLGDRYTVDDAIGQGGMAVVYRALDQRHHRSVAIKVLRPGLVRGEGAARFLREIRVLAGLVHPHVVPLYDSGELPGDPPLLFFVMPYLTGESLRARMARGQLPLDRALRVAREVASALDYAHRQGVVHRDIKPENIFLHEGAALVTDFGIARLVSEAASGTATGPGVIVGTPAYMSPEQAGGGETVDGRADQYALACVLQEMLTGEPPFGGDGRVVIGRHVTATPPSVRNRRPELPPAIEQATLRALSKDPVQRYPTVAAFAAALTTPLAGITPELIERPGEEVGCCLVVLPFENASAEPGTDYLSDGLTEELITAFGRVPELRVASRSSSFALKGMRRDARAIGKLLGVNTILEGSVRKQDDRLRITAQLSDATDDRLLWSERYDRKAADLFAVQEEIASTIVRTLLGGPLAPTASPVATRPRYTANATAYALYLKGRYAWNKRTAAGVEEAIRHFHAAIDADPGYAPAWSGLADSWALGVDYRATTVAEGMAHAREYATKALTLDESLAEAHTSLAWVTFIHDWDWETSGRHFHRAVELDPRYPTARQWHAMHLAAMGQVWEAVAEGRTSVTLDPASPSIRRSTGWLYYYARDPGAGVEDLRRAVVMNPESGESHVLLGHALAWAGQYEEAEIALREALGYDPEDSHAMAVVTRLRVFEGRLAEAREMRDRMLALTRHRYVSPSDLARAHLALGDYDAAFEMLERAFTERRGLLVWLRIEPIFDPIRGDPRFSDLLRRMRLDW